VEREGLLCACGESEWVAARKRPITQERGRGRGERADPKTEHRKAKTGRKVLDSKLRPGQSVRPADVTGFIDIELASKTRATFCSSVGL
jgi:hypothetical protein